MPNSEGSCTASLKNKWPLQEGVYSFVVCMWGSITPARVCENRWTSPECPLQYARCIFLQLTNLAGVYSCAHVRIDDPHRSGYTNGLSLRLNGPDKNILLRCVCENRRTSGECPLPDIACDTWHTVCYLLASVRIDEPHGRMYDKTHKSILLLASFVVCMRGLMDITRVAYAIWHIKVYITWHSVGYLT